jgi:hypothetical protein
MVPGGFGVGGAKQAAATRHWIFGAKTNIEKRNKIYQMLINNTSKVWFSGL